MIDTANFRYLPDDPESLNWGLQLRDCGYTRIEGGEPYPPQHHEEDYLFNWENGRVLDEYQIVYISGGKGSVESGEKGTTRPRSLCAGQVFVVHPDVWHRYRPDSKTGWEECWVGFSGPLADQVMQCFFERSSPVVEPGLDSHLLSLFQGITDAAKRSNETGKGVLAGKVLELLGYLYRSLQDQNVNVYATAIEKARCVLQTRALEEVDLVRLAADLHMSYSSFRSQFKNITGISPKQYQIQIRVNRAKALLRGSQLTIQEIADELNFTSIYYFSRHFKDQCGLSPLAYRKNVAARRF